VNEGAVMKCAFIVTLASIVALCAIEIGAAQPVTGGPNQPAPAAATQPAASQPLASGPTTAMPGVSLEDMALLVKTARRAFETALAGMPEQGASYQPESLAGLSGMVHLVLRSQGAALVQADSGEMGITGAAAKAGTLLGRAALEKKLKIDNRGADLGLELEWLGPREYIDAGCDEGGRWTEALLHSFEPGGEGIGVEFRAARGWTRPSEIITLNYSPDLALRAAEVAANLTHADKLNFGADIKYFRFRAYHLWQPTARAMPILLTRGEVLVPPERTRPEDIDAAIKRMGEYLHYRQNRDGWFSHEYLPSADQYSEGNSATVQMAAMQGLAAYARWSGRPEILSDARKGVRRNALFLTPLVAVKEINALGEAKGMSAGLALDFPGHKRQLEISARLLLATFDLVGEWPTTAKMWETPASQPATAPATTAPGAMPTDNRWADLTVGACISGLVEGLLASQRDDGRLEMLLDPPAKGAPEDVEAAGRAMSALAAAYSWCQNQGTPPSPSQSADAGAAARKDLSDRIERTFAKALPHYRQIVKGPMDAAAAAALAEGLCRAYACTNDAQASDLAFEILDKFAAAQVTPDSCPWPELDGAINAREVGIVGIDTAEYLSALAEGLQLAERIGDAERTKKYRAVVQRAERFVLQLEVREDGAFYIRSPRDALGGVRTAPWDNRIRADYCADALLALSKARESLRGSHR